jgi:hypothetical protein
MSEYLKFPLPLNSIAIWAPKGDYAGFSIGFENKKSWTIKLNFT